MESRMNSYNPFICDWVVETKKAKRMTIDGLYASIDDCQECIRLDINPNKYFDQISIYRKELYTRKVVVIK